MKHKKSLGLLVAMTLQEAPEAHRRDPSSLDLKDADRGGPKELRRTSGGGLGDKAQPQTQLPHMDTLKT